MSSVIGTGLLLRQNLRRDRLLVPVWLVVSAGLVFASAAATSGLYATEAARIEAAEGINDSPAIVALYGPILDVTSEGELAMTKMTVLYAALAAILFVVIVRRHTRVEEESGRSELVGGTAVGRDAPLAASVAQGAVVSVVLGLLVALANIAGGLDPAGSAGSRRSAGTPRCGSGQGHGGGCSRSTRCSPPSWSALPSRCVVGATPGRAWSPPGRVRRPAHRGWPTPSR